MTDFFVEFLMWSLGVFGASNIIVFSAIFKPIREYFATTPFLGKILPCILCTSFWVGCFWSAVLWSPVRADVSNLFFRLLFSGCLGSATTWLIYLLISNRMKGQ